MADDIENVTELLRQEKVRFILHRLRMVRK